MKRAEQMGETLAFIVSAGRGMAAGAIYSDHYKTAMSGCKNSYPYFYGDNGSSLFDSLFGWI